MTDAPIGIFDSGVGGLTVARAIKDQLPSESILYIGDTAHSPYGPKQIADVRGYALEVLDDLVDQGVKMLVIACNTASAAMLRDARERYSVPVIEVIQPAVRRACRHDPQRPDRRDRHGGHDRARGPTTTCSPRQPQLTALRQACPRFVEFVEAGVTDRRRGARRRRGVPRAAAARRTSTPSCSAAPTTRSSRARSATSWATEVAARLQRHRDRQRRLPHPRRPGASRAPRRAPPSYRYEATGDSADDFLAPRPPPDRPGDLRGRPRRDRRHQHSATLPTVPRPTPPTTLKENS